MAQRYQREIEEILDKANEGPASEGGAKQPPRRRQQAQPRQPRSRNPRSSPLHFSPARLLLIGIAFLFAALILNSLAPAFAAPAAWLGIGLLVVGYIMFFTRPRGLSERRWRGQVIEDHPEDGPLQRFWRWITRG